MSDEPFEDDKVFPLGGHDDATMFIPFDTGELAPIETLSSVAEGKGVPMEPVRTFISLRPHLGHLPAHI